MLGKLLKYDFRFGGRTFLAMTAFVFIAALSFRFTVFSELARNVMVFVILGLVVVVVLTMILLVQLFSHSLYGKNGYLMHTLPVTGWSLVGAKIITAVAWVHVIVAAGLLGLLLANMPDNWAVFWRNIVDYRAEFLQIYCVLLAGVLSTLSCAYMSIAAANFCLQRGVMALALVFYVAVQYLTGIFSPSVITPVSLFVVGGVSGPMQFWNTTTVWPAVLFSLALSAVYYCVTVFFMGRRINLR